MEPVLLLERLRVLLLEPWVLLELLLVLLLW